MKIGYIRVSTKEQNTIRQDALMAQLGVEKIYVDKMSGSNAQRPELLAMMNFVREGDTVIVSEIARFARNTMDFLKLTKELREKGVEFESQKEKIDTSTAPGQFMMTVFAAMAELERAYILERQREGIDAAKAAGKYKGREAIPVDDVKFIDEYTLWREGKQTARKAMSNLGLKPNTFYRRVADYENKTGQFAEGK